MKIPESKYQQGQNKYRQLLAKQNRFLGTIGNLRLVVFLIGLAAIIPLYYTGRDLPATVIFVVFGAAFIFLVNKHNREKEILNYLSALYEVNSTGLARLAGEWRTFADMGAEFKDLQHPYSDDLDIFGQGSVFQWINTAQTYLGRQRLAQTLANPCLEPEVIERRQQAIGELADHFEWRHKFMAEGKAGAGKIQAPEPLFNWAGEYKPFYAQYYLKFFVYGFPVLTLILIVLSLIPHGISGLYPFLAVAIQFLALVPGNKERTKALTSVYKYERNLKSYSGMINLLEKLSCKSDYLIELKLQVSGSNQPKASTAVKKLAAIADSISIRYNSIYIAINILTLWDYRCMMALESWKRENGRRLQGWLETIGEVEALASLALLKFDNPDWAWPVIKSGKPQLTAKEMGHPLLSAKRVRNDLAIQEPYGILLITGSNMSGKSTLLRTAGLNLVLAYTGAPVCASDFSATPMKIYTCMRIGDNLEKSISSFYAELLRIKMVIEAAEGEEQVFFLLDEIFKGTNSEDRHIGAKFLVKQLSKAGAVGMVSTHDLELAELEKETGGKVANYHFREFYEDDKINFDYKLRAGVSTTRNAMYLIKLAGIEIPE